LIEFLSSEFPFPQEVFVDDLLVGVLGRVQLLPFVALVVHHPVGGQLERQILPLPHPHSRDGGVVVGSEQDHGSERVLPHLIQSLVHPGNQIAGHEDHGQLLWIQIFAVPDAAVVLVEILPEIVDGFRRFLVGVDAFEIVEVERCLGQSGEGVLLFRFLQQGRLGRVHLFRLLGRLVLFSILLLVLLLSVLLLRARVRLRHGAEGREEGGQEEGG